MINKVILCLFLLLHSACAVGPDYVRPPVVTPLKYKEAKNISKNRSIKWKRAEPCDQYNRGQWWLIFNDPVLNKLEDQLNIYNQTIINAYYNYKQARALVDEAAAGFFPTLAGSLNVTRQKGGGGSTSSNASSSSTSSTSITSTHSWIFDASWEPDIWGLVRRSVEASAAGAEANAALYAATRLSTQALLAQTYFELRGLDVIQKLLNETVISDKKALQLTRHRYASGVAARTDMVQAESVLESVEAQAINNGILRSQYEHAIAVLIGEPPSLFGLASSSLHDITPPAIPVDVPSVLLERRPDIAQAERLMAQANAQIGVAVAAYFPALTLNGTASTAGKGFGHLFSVPFLNWSLGADIAETFLDGGLRRATVKAATAGYYASVANYRQAVLSAFQNVEDNLVSLRILNKQAVLEKQTVANAKLALKLIMNQYKAGTVDYTSVITAQINAYNAEQNAINVNYLRMVSAVNLVKALGGGWD